MGKGLETIFEGQEEGFVVGDQNGLYSIIATEISSVSL